MPYVRLCRRRDVTTDQIFPEIMPLQLSNLPSNGDRLRAPAPASSNCRLHCVPIAGGGGGCIGNYYIVAYDFRLIRLFSIRTCWNSVLEENLILAKGILFRANISNCENSDIKFGTRFLFILRCFVIAMEQRRENSIRLNLEWNVLQTSRSL